jgi:hypothetical protein
MADEQARPTARKGKLKNMILVGGLLLLEGAVIIAAMMFVGGDPASVSASEGLESVEIAVEDRIVEILVLDGQLPNAKTGVTYLYSTEIYAQVKQRFTQRVEEELSQFSNEIKADIAALWKTSEPAHFQEPRLENLTRKVHAMLSERFGMDPETDEPLLAKTVINMQPGFRIDN